MKFWQEKIDLIPPEFIDTTGICIEANPYYPDSASLNVGIYYKQPETDEEVQTRVMREKARRDYTERRELCQLEELKKKYNV